MQDWCHQEASIDVHRTIPCLHIPRGEPRSRRPLSSLLRVQTAYESINSWLTIHNLEESRTSITLPIIVKTSSNHSSSCNKPCTKIMAATIKTPGSVSWPQGPHTQWEPCANSSEIPRNIATINNLKLDPHLQPVTYNIEGTHPESRILIEDVKILDSTGRLPYSGDVLIEGKSIDGSRFPCGYVHLLNLLFQAKELEQLAKSQTRMRLRMIQESGYTVVEDGLSYLDWEMDIPILPGMGATWRSLEILE